MRLYSWSYGDCLVLLTPVVWVKQDWPVSFARAQESLHVESNVVFADTSILAFLVQM